MSEELKKQAEAIRHEFMPGTNTASRVGEVLSAIVDEIDEIYQTSNDSIKNSNEFLNEYLDGINGEVIPGGSIVQKLKATLNSKNAIKEAIQSKTVNMPDNLQFSEYAAQIESIQKSDSLWIPNSTWWDIKSIVQEPDNQLFVYKTIQLLQATEVTTTFTGGVAYKTSDGSLYTNESATHTWDTTQDKKCIENEENTYNTRWVITYHLSPNIDMNYIKKSCLFFIMDAVLPTAARFGDNNYGEVLSILNSFDMINGADFTNVTDFSYLFSYCYFLKSIPQIDTSNGVNFKHMFSSCFMLVSVPQINTSKGVDFNSMLGACISLTSIPSLDTSKGKDFYSMFEACYTLTSIPPLDTSKGTDFRNMFNQCHKLASIPSLNTSNGIYHDNMFSGCASLKSALHLNFINYNDDNSSIFDSCYLLEELEIANLSNSLTLSDCKLLNHESLIYLINNLTRVTTLRTLTLGETNLAKLTTAEKAIAMNKGWHLE